jgi:hypothetical protein
LFNINLFLLNKMNLPAASTPGNAEAGQAVLCLSKPVAPGFIRKGESGVLRLLRFGAVLFNKTCDLL